jgi:hypothetical protein
MDLGLPQYFRGLALAELLPGAGPSGAGQAAANTGRADQVIADLGFVLAVRDQFPVSLLRAAYQGLARAYPGSRELAELRHAVLVPLMEQRSGQIRSASWCTPNWLALGSARSNSGALDSCCRSGQPARPFCHPPARPGWPMKSSSAWLTSSAWVQMIACGPPAMRVKRALFSNAGSLRLVAS